MNNLRMESIASPQERSDLFEALRRAAKAVEVYEQKRSESEGRDISGSPFDFSASSPKFNFVEEANECIERLWSMCARLVGRDQLIKGRLEKDSSNSSRPPSSDTLHAKLSRYHKSPALPTGRKQGAQMGHPGCGRQLQPLSAVDEVIACRTPTHCPNCSSELLKAEVSQRKQVAYLKDKRLIVKEFQLYRARCGHCKRFYGGELPPGTPQGAFGPCVLSVIGVLTGRYRLSKRQAAACLEDLLGLKLSVGTVSNAEHLLSEAIEDVAFEVQEALKSSAIHHVDETAHYRKHQLKWMWILTDDRLAYLSIGDHRNREKARSLLGGKDNLWVSDRYPVYSFLPRKQHQYCWSHLKRDIKAVVDHPDPSHSRIGRRLDAWRRLIFREHRQRLSELDQLGVLGKTLPLGKKMRRYLKRFRCALRDGKRLSGHHTSGFCHNLIRHWRRLWNCLLDSRMPSTNNHAERMLRPIVLWRKVSLGTQSERGDRYVERMSTIQLSCHLQGRHLLSFLERALNCFWSGHDPPSLVPGIY